MKWHCESSWEQEFGFPRSLQSSQVEGVFSMRPAKNCQVGIGCVQIYVCFGIAERATERSCVLQNSDAQLQAALTAAQSDLDWVVSEIKAGKLSQQEAEECIQQVSDSVPSITAAAAAVQRAKARGQEDVWGWESARVKAGSEGWTPKVDEPVRLVKLGGKTGKVLHLHTSSL